MYCEKKNVICNSSIKICLKKRKKRKEKRKHNMYTSVVHPLSGTERTWLLTCH